MTDKPPGPNALIAAIPSLAGHELVAVLDQVADGVTVQDPTGRLRYANAAAARTLGFPSPEALVAAPVAEVMAQFEVFDEAGARFPPDLLPGRRALRGERPPPATVRFRLAATGEERWAVVSATPILDGGGRVAAAVNVFRDATERRRADEATARLAAIVESSDDAIVARTLDGTITDWNRGAERLYGWTAAEAIGRHVAFLVPPGQADELAALNERLARGERVPPIEAVRVRKDGARVDVSVGLAPVRDAAGRVVRAATIARDVTERKRSEEAQARLAAIVASSDDAIIGKTLEGIVTSWNPGAERLYGWTAAEVVGRSLALIVPPERPDELPALLARLRRGERVDHFETIRLAKDGRRLDVSVSIAPIRDRAGAVVGAATIARDVTERKRAEVGQRLLAEAGAVLVAGTEVEAMLDALARLAVPRLAARCAVYLVADGGAVARAAVAPADAAAVESVLPGRDPADATVRRVLRTGQPDLATDPAVSAMVVPLAARGRTFGAVTFAAAEGRRYDAADLALAREVVGRAALAVDNARLLGEARAAEARFRGLFAGVADAILVADGAGRYLDANAAATALLGYDRDELLRLGVADVVAAGTPWAESEFARYAKEGIWRGELEVRRKDGTHVPVEALATVVRLPTGPLYLAALRDASERRAAERLRQDVLAMVSHDLRSPLTYIKGAAQLLRRRGEGRPQAVAAILTNAARMERLIGDLADAVRLDAGQLPLWHAPVDLVSLVGERVAEARARVPGQVVRVEAPAAPVVGRWDRGRVGQVVQNLLDNALTYAGDAGEVVVRVEAVGNEARVAVADRGPGIAPEHLPRLFERFYRAEATGAGGLGLGLYLARMLVAAHGGRVWVESTPGQGSTFTFALPCDPPEQEPA